jgi:hypothetical protein
MMRAMATSVHQIVGVIPAQAGIHLDRAFFAASKAKWIPAFAGMTSF